MTNTKQDQRRRRGIYLLPNLLTTGALFAGFYSIVAAIDGNFIRAAGAIYVAIFLDGLDGRVARMTSTESDFGKEFDSLADMVSFGLAPAIVTYQWGVERLAEYGVAWGRVGWLAVFLFTVAAAFRLARFNTTSVSDKRYFEGLPSPSAAAVIAGMVWVSADYQIQGLIAIVAGISISVLTGLAMVSGFRYLSFKDFDLSGRMPFANVLLIPLVLIIVALNPPVVLFSFFVIYAVSGPFIALIRVCRRDKELETGHS